MVYTSSSNFQRIRINFIDIVSPKKQLLQLGKRLDNYQHTYMMGSYVFSLSVTKDGSDMDVFQVGFGNVFREVMQ